MKQLVEIAKYTYELTFDSIVDYDWLSIGELFIESKNIYEDLLSRSLISNGESKDDILYWQDVFFMEVAENIESFNQNDALIQKLKTHSGYISNQEFISNLPRVTTEQGREMLIDDMIDNINADQLIPDELIEDVLKKKSRGELREKFKEWSEESSNKEKYPYLKYIAIAAILIVGFFIWQPTQSTDEEILAYYSENAGSIGSVTFEKLNKSISNSNERGEDFLLDNYTKNETEKALSGLSLYKEGNYDRAKKILKELNPKERSKQILFFLAVTQLNSNETDSAISNLEYLLDQPNFNFTNEAKFHLALGYLKKGDRKKSKNLLKQLTSIEGKIGKESNFILKEMRWF
jgi:hypothetical protein